MIIVEKAIYAQEGCKIAKKSQCKYADDFGSAFTLLEGETEDDFVEVAIADLPPEKPQEPDYPQPKEDTELNKRINARIRAEYTESEEHAINRQRDTKPEEFKRFYDFCEMVKAEEKAKEI